MRVNSEPLCMIVMADDDVLDGSCDVGAGTEEVLGSRADLDDRAR